MHGLILWLKLFRCLWGKRISWLKFETVKTKPFGFYEAVEFRIVATSLTKGHMSQKSFCPNEGDLTDAACERCKRDIYGGHMTHDDDKRLKELSTKWCFDEVSPNAIYEEENEVCKERDEALLHLKFVLSKVRELQEKAKQARASVWNEAIEMSYTCSSVGCLLTKDYIKALEFARDKEGGK